jgi:hypothetical protein
MGARKRGKLAVQPIQGMTIGTLFRVLARNGFKVDTRCYGRLAYLAVWGVLNSMYGACETFFNARDIQAAQIKHPPLFIIGHWRSGTTHLHNLLSFDENFTCPTAYQCLFPHHFIFSQVAGPVFNYIAPAKRPMDNVPFGSDVPHEEEFALAADSTVSPYMRTLFPVTGDKGYAELDLNCVPEEAQEKWKDSLVLFLKKVTLSDGGRIVLKSPPHLGRVGTLLDLFPEAQFIHIVRNPYVVYPSTHRLWRDLFRYAHLQIPGPALVDDIILSWYCELFSLFERDRRLVPPGALHELKFEDLEDEPETSLEKLYGELRLPGFTRFLERVRPYLATVKGYRKNDYHLEEADREKVSQRWRFTFERYGYPL